MSAQPSLVSASSDSEVLKPSNDNQWQVVRDRSAFPNGKYFAYDKNGNKEQIGGFGFGGGVPFANDTSASPIIVAVSIPGATPTDGYTFEVNILTTNGGPSTLSITQNGLGALPIVDSDGNPLVAGMLVHESIYLFALDTQNNRYQLLGLSKPASVCAPVGLTFFVAKNGNDATGDGSICKPFLTIQKGIDVAYTVASIGNPTINRPVVMVMAGTYVENPVLKANVFVRGVGFNSTRVTGNWTLDATFTTPPSNDARSGWADIGVFGNVTADFNALNSNEGKLYAWNTRFSLGAVTLTAFSNINQFLVFGGEFFSTYTQTGMNTYFENVNVENTITLNHTTRGANFFTQVGGSRSSLTANGGAGPQAMEVYLYGGIKDGASLILNAPVTTEAISTAIPNRALLTNTGTLNRINDAFGLAYTPSNLLDWSGVAPITVQDALDRIAAKITPIP